ncbi:lytic transglycosylase domain-containing protein [Methylocella sp.]|uniref:lytic transglycosylase domain-containing protein n=1 Tax=Methylocella sp. TaxID=1978226 RepID=UPI003782E3DC
MRSTTRLFALALGLAGAAPAMAATCDDPRGFTAFLADIRTEAAAQGIAPAAVAALDGLTPEPKVVSLDRGQHVFKQSFEEFSARMISPSRLKQGANRLKQYGSALSRIEAAYGVPGPVIVAIWGLETDYGAVTGDVSTLRALATLAFDCRRSAKFQGELLDALRLVARGDLKPAEMKGAWAGELGQAQFMPSSYLKYAVDFNGDGRRDLLRDPLDVMASIANYLKEHGWRSGAGWEPGEPNFDVIRQWNAADVYARTIAAFATKLAATQAQ